MLIKAKPRKRLEPGVHPVSLKDIVIARDKDSGMPYEMADPSNGEPCQAIDVYFLNDAGYGVADRIWLFAGSDAIINQILSAIGLERKGDEQVPLNQAIGKKLFVVVAKVLLYDNLRPRIDPVTGEQAWHHKLVHKFYKCIDPSMPPKLLGNPQINNGIASGEFLVHKDMEHGEFIPRDYTPGNTTTSRDEEAFGT